MLHDFGERCNITVKVPLGAIPEKAHRWMTVSPKKLTFGLNLPVKAHPTSPYRLTFDAFHTRKSSPDVPVEAHHNPQKPLCGNDLGPGKQALRVYKLQIKHSTAEFFCGDEKSKANSGDRL
jgi:hypothetical protein